MDNSTVTGSTVVTSAIPYAASDFNNRLMVYIGVSIAAGILICIVIICCILAYKRGTFRRVPYVRRGTRRLFLRGFSTVSQCGVVDSTGEFEMVNPGTSVSSDDGVGRPPGSGQKTTPKKPNRRRSKTPSANAQYENVTLNPDAGFIVRKSPSMNSGIQYIDATLGSHISERDEDLDEVFLDGQ